MPTRPAGRAPVAALSLALAAAALAGAGCNLAGPAALRDGRQDYNAALQQTANEQLLLNLVRLRYRDAPLFLEVTNITATYQLDAGAGASATIPEQRLSANQVLSPNLRAGWLERPTISYVPLQGDKFVSQMLAPISLEHLLLLYHSGWSAERIFRVCVQRLGPLANAPSASGPTPQEAPEFAGFLAATRLLRKLQLRRAIDLGLVEADGRRHLALLIDAPEGDPDADALCAALGAPAGARRLQLVQQIARGAGERVGVETRSLLGCMFYLSHGVDVPEEHAALGLVTRTAAAGGGAFDWGEVLDGLFRVTVEPPEHGAAVAVRYRGTTFHVADTDLTTKSTFSFLSQLFALQAGATPSGGPLLTLSIGG